MKIAKKWISVGAMLDEEQFSPIKQIAEEEGTTVSTIIKVALNQFVLEHAVFHSLKGLFTSRLIGTLTPEALVILTPIFQKHINACMRDLSNVKEKHPEVTRLEYQLITELAKMNDEISIRLDPKKRGKGRPNKDKNKPKGLDTLQSFNELKAITDKLNDEERQKTADVIGKAVHAFKKGEDPIPQVTEDLKQLMKKKA